MANAGIDPNNYLAMVLFGRDGRAEIRAGFVTARVAGELLVDAAGEFHERNELPMPITAATARMLLSAGWAPPFDPRDHDLSDRDWMELVVFAGKCEWEGFGYAADQYPPRFEDEALRAAIAHGPMDRLKQLLDHHREAVDAWWERPDAPALIDAHEAR